MKRFAMVVLAVAMLMGCGKPPEPTGPAAEAPTEDILITMDEPSVSAGLAIAE